MKNTEQENFWIGAFVMNTSKEMKVRNLQRVDYQYINQFSKIFLNNRIIINSAIEIRKTLELIWILKNSFPKCKTFGIEINKKAHSILKKQT